MPLLEDLKDQLKSDSADLKHTGDRWGGSISAALFLREFIGNVQNWVHCDIAGPAMGDRVRGWDPKGGTGHGVLTFLDLIERASRNAGTATSAAPAAPAAAARLRRSRRRLRRRRPRQRRRPRPRQLRPRRSGQKPAATKAAAPRASAREEALRSPRTLAPARPPRVVRDADRRTA